MCVCSSARPHYSNSSPEIALQGSATATLDPEIKILELRLTALRRGVHKNVRRGSTTGEIVSRLLQHYLCRGEYMIGGAEALDRAQVAPPSASTDRSKWDLSKRPAGPIALLLHSVGLAGMTMDTEGHVWGPFGSISVTESPLHLYRQVIIEAAAQAAIVDLEKRRPGLAPEQGIDWTLTRGMWSRCPEKVGNGHSQRHMLAFAAGGHWRQHRSRAADVTESDICILCGQGRDDDEHLWTCQALRPVHAKHPLVIKCCELLPIQLSKFGIVPHVCTDPQQALWGGTARGLNRWESAWIGHGIGGNLTPGQRRTLVDQGKTIHALMLHHAAYDAVTLNNRTEESDGAATWTEEGEAPDQPTVFTDGSVRPPMPTWISSSAIGAYWPASQPPSLILDG